MVSKLTFKGDKPKKKKKIAKKVEKFDEQCSIDPELIEKSWTSATMFGDLNGPMIIANYGNNTSYNSTNDVPFVLSTDDLGSISLNKSTSSIDEGLVVNFPLEDTDPLAYKTKIHTIEPTDVQQVFVSVELSTMISGAVNPNRTKLALKGSNDKYLTAAGSKVDASSGAISSSQIWEFERVLNRDEGVWFRLINNNKKMLVKDGSLKMVNIIDNESANDLFVIRVQAKNSMTGKRLLRDHEEFKRVGGDTISHSVRTAVDSLTKKGIEVTNNTVKRLKNAALNGKINEQLILERQKGKSDSRC